MKITANQLGLFIGCLVHITEQYLAEIETLYNPNFDTKTDFVLKSVSIDGFIIEAPDGINQKLLAIEDYGVKCKLVLNTMLFENQDALEKIGSEIEKKAKDLADLEDDEIDVIALSLLTVYASQGYDVFNWLPVGLAVAENLKDLKLQEINNAITKPEL